MATIANSVAEYRAQIDAKVEVIRLLRENIVNLEKLNECVTSEASNLNAKYDQLVINCGETETKIKEIEDKNLKLTQELDKRDHELRHLNEKDQQQNKLIVELKNGETGLNAKCQQLVDENNQNVAKLREIDAQSKADKEELERLKEAIKSRDAMVESGEQRVKRMQKTINWLRDDIKANGDHSKTNEITSLKLTNEQLNGKFNVLECNYNQLENEKNALRAEKDIEVKLKVEAEQKIIALEKSVKRYKSENEKNKRRLVATKLHARDQERIIKTLPQVLGADHTKITDDAFNLLIQKILKDIDLVRKVTAKKSAQTTKRTVTDANIDSEQSRVRAKRVATLREKRVQCAYCDKSFDEIGVCQRHMTMVHMIDGLARNFDDTRVDTEPEQITIDDTDDSQ